MNNMMIKVATAVAFVVMVAVNYLAVSLPLAGRDTGAISDSYPNLFAPAGYTFSIWGVIYTLLFVYVIYQFKVKKDSLILKVNKLFIVNALLNAMWIFAWHYLVIWLSVIIMVGILVTLIKIADILRIEKLNSKEQWLVQLPFSVYFGWITVATIANITTFLVSIGWNGFGIAESFWTALVLIVGAVIGTLRMKLDRFFPYGLVLVWAYGGILNKHLFVFNGNYPVVIWTSILCIMAFMAMMVLISNNQEIKETNKSKS